MNTVAQDCVFRGNAREWVSEFECEYLGRKHHESAVLADSGFDSRRHPQWHARSECGALLLAGLRSWILSTRTKRTSSPATDAPAFAAQDRRCRKGNGRQAAWTANHRDLDRPAKGQDLRRQRFFCRKSGLDRHEGSFDPDGRLQRYPEAQAASLQHLQQRADALYAAYHLVGCCDACRRPARLSGVARLHPHADGVCREDVELDQDGRARHHHARRDHAREFLASAVGGAEGRAAAGDRRRTQERPAQE